MSVCAAVTDVPVLRKDFLLEEDEIDISYRCGADAVLLISGILLFKLFFKGIHLFDCLLIEFFHS
ncbi:MAG: hypothetical protein MJ234_02510 [bacterium]|nr:hypothetical protein [bacterium]